MAQLSMLTDITIDVGGCTSHVYDVWVDYEYHPGSPAFTPRGEYGPIDPPEPPHVEVVAARWRKVEQIPAYEEKYADCPGWVVAMLSDDDEFCETLIGDAEKSGQPDPDYLYEMRRDEPDEAQEWRDYDPDC